MPVPPRVIDISFLTVDDQPRIFETGTDDSLENPVRFLEALNRPKPDTKHLLRIEHDGNDLGRRPQNRQARLEPVRVPILNEATRLYIHLRVLHRFGRNR